MQILSTSLSALNSSTTRLNVTANNIANSNTPDFKQKSVNLQEAPNSSGVQDELPATKARAYSCGFLFQRTLHN